MASSNKIGWNWTDSVSEQLRARKNSNAVRWYVLALPTSRQGHYQGNPARALRMELERRTRNGEPVFEYFAPSYVEVRKQHGELVRNCIRMQGRVISIEYEYGDNPEPFPLRKLQELVAERYPKTRWFKEECWNSADEFRQAIFACKTFEEVADILMPEQKTSVWQRIEEYFLRAGFLMLAAMFLYHVVWRLIQKFWLWATG